VKVDAEIANCQLVEATEGTKIITEVIFDFQFSEKMKVAYPTAEEELIDFLNCCRLNNSEVMLCPRCTAIFEKEDTKVLENY